ncbi:MAG: hypothetical protein JWQ38_1636 [Flavipsychrobacter sp.]|nr:hypothetical protein [Flavipsychrobacter sp.]
MKTIRNILTTTLLTLFAFGSVVYTSCKNKCGSTTCQSGGVCVDNKCVCPTGYSGTSCQTGWSDASIGTYNCVRSNCAPARVGATTWVSTVVKSGTNGGYTINITNFDNNNITVEGTIDSAIGGVNKIKVTPPSGSSGINATGTYTNGVISLHFTTASSVGGAGYSCNMTMTKQ